MKRHISFLSLTELMHIGLMSPIHLQRVIDILLEMLRTKSISNDFHSLSKICDAFSDCPCFVDLILQLHTPSELLGPLESVCNNWSPTNSMLDREDESTAKSFEEERKFKGIQQLYYIYGRILNFVIVVVKRFKVSRCQYNV